MVGSRNPGAWGDIIWAQELCSLRKSANAPRQRMRNVTAPKSTTLTELQPLLSSSISSSSSASESSSVSSEEASDDGSSAGSSGAMSARAGVVNNRVVRKGKHIIVYPVFVCFFY